MYKAESVKIAVVGIGYVGLSISILLAQYYDVVAVDIDNNKIDCLKKNKSPLKNKLMEEYLETKKLKLKATTDYKMAYQNADYVIISVPTNFDYDTNTFDTSIVERVISQVLEINSETTIVIKSTVPIGFTKRIKEEKFIKNILFCPEFLRETEALLDCLYPTRIIISTPDMFEESEIAKLYRNLLNKIFLSKKIEVLYMESSEAEAVKLFSNTFLAMRVSFFNELDTYAEITGLRTNRLIQGVCSDPRIGDWYNNPSFGYGGYCLPKDSMQLLSHFKDVPQKMIRAVVESNSTRKKYIAQRVLDIVKNKILDKGISQITIGIYRLVAKTESDNFRESSIYDVIDIILKYNIKMIIYEPTITEQEEGIELVNDFSDFIKRSDIIVANRYDNKLDCIKQKVFTRDIFYRD